MRITVLILIVLAVLLPAFGQASDPSPAPQDKFVGVWVFNEEKTDALNLHRGVSLGSDYFTHTITRRGEYLSITVKRGPVPHLAAEQYNVDKKYRAELQWSYLCDGQAHPTFYGSIICRFTDQNVIEGSNVVDRSGDVMVGKHKAYYWKREISSDGTEMKDYGYKDKTMKKMVTVSVYDRHK